MGAIFYLSLLPAGEVPRAGTLMPDYVNHGLAYLVSAFFIFVAWQRTRRSGLAITFAVLFGWSLIFGLGMEFAQKYLTANREFSLWDLLADGAGVAVLLVFLLVLRKAGKPGGRLYSILVGNPQK